MTPLVSCEAVAKAYGARTLFTGISFGIFDGDRIGLLGLNGSGKSTLLRILAGLDSPDEGRRVLRKNCRVGYVPQEREFPADATVEDVLQSSLDTVIPPPTPMDRAAQLAITCGQAGFDDRNQLASALSGGWKKRLMVAAELVKSPDVLLLDEPTNHLDFEGLAWLEDLLRAPRFSYLVISHDRLFLERVASRVVELNARYPNGYLSIDGPYSTFLEKREELIHAQALQQEKMANRLRREVEWLRRGPKARTTKSQARIDGAFELMAHLADVKQRNSTKSVGVDFVATERETHTLIAAKNVRFVRGEKIILDGITLNLTKGMRLGLVGLNGTGKTTFLKLLAGDLVPESGTIKRAPDLKCVYFTQNRASLNPSKTLRETFCPLGVDHVVYRDREVHVASWARRFLFRNEALDLTVGRLSGGEQARILIAQLMLQPADVLLLDEPTNDLDIPTLEVLEASLEEFPGAIVLVSHDRFMIDGLSTHILGLDDQGKAQLVADLDQWEREVLRPKAKRPASDAKPGVGLKKSPKKKMTFKEKFEYEQMEATILKAETKLASVHAALESAGQDPARLRTLSQELEAAQQTVDQLYARWAELEKLHEPD